MYEQLDKTIEELADDKSGWVTRRDAAEALGKFARRAIDALEQYREEKDVDVRSAVEAALHEVALPSAPAKSAYPLAELVEGCHRPPHREVASDGEGFRIHLKIDAERAQTVYVESTTRRDDAEIIRVYTVVGEVSDEVVRWGLKNNAKLLHCALAQEKHEGEARLILVANFARATATPQGLKDAVKEMALYGDWIESRTTGEDVL